MTQNQRTKCRINHRTRNEKKSIQLRVLKDRFQIKSQNQERKEVYSGPSTYNTPYNTFYCSIPLLIIHMIAASTPYNTFYCSIPLLIIHIYLPLLRIHIILRLCRVRSGMLATEMRLSIEYCKRGVFNERLQCPTNAPTNQPFLS